MIDLTPLDVRKKKGDFRRGLRGYDAPQVDDFLDIVADRLETLVRENLGLQERVARFENQVTDHREREKALTEALVTAQEMREEVRAQTAREADAARRDAENDAVRIRAGAQQVREREEELLRRLRGRQLEFLQTYRAFLERELAELASMVRGLELNGAMGDALMTPPRLSEPTTTSGPRGSAIAADDQWAGSPQPARERAIPGAAAQQRAGSPQPAPEPAAAQASEPELILSDDDVLPDEAVPTGAIDLAPPAAERSTGGTVGSAETEAAPATDSEPAEPSRSAEPLRAEGDLDLDLIPELDDFAELGDFGSDDTGRSLEAMPAEAAEPDGPSAERSASKRRDAGDDTDDLLRSLFGDEH